MYRNHTVTAIAVIIAVAGFAGSTIASSCGSKSAHTHEAGKKTEAAGVAQTTKAETADIVTTATNAGSFKTLVTAVKAADLVETLQGDGPFTVFAPSDEAFSRLPEGTVASLLKDKKQLRAVLTYHVVPGAVLAKDVVGLDSAATVNGQPVTITVDRETVMVNEATIVATDIVCSNGVIHVIDQVILPKTETN